MKRIISLLIVICLLTAPVGAVDTLSDDAVPIQAPSACLLEKSTGQVLYEKNAYEHRLIASVTKVMTLLLVMEALDDGTLTPETLITASRHAAEMGGSQIWLEEGEQMTVEEMLKCVTVVSANDCAVALAEHLAGSEEAFVQKMNDRARQLGMADTHFTDCTGLFDSPEHYSCAHDVAVMARELISHEKIKTYSTIWMDNVRGGEFALSNTNKLIRYYPGATGLKTGYTSAAGYCLAATAQRDGVEYVAAVLGAETSEQRFGSARTLLDHGFANYGLCPLPPDEVLPPIPVVLGQADSVQPVYPAQEHILLEKSQLSALRYDLRLSEQVQAPVQAGDSLGVLTVYAGDTAVADVPLVAGNSVDRMGVWDIFKVLLKILCCDGQAAPTPAE